MEKFYLFNGIMVAYLAVYVYICHKKYFKKDSVENRQEIPRIQRYTTAMAGNISKKAV